MFPWPHLLLDDLNSAWTPGFVRALFLIAIVFVLSVILTGCFNGLNRCGSGLSGDVLTEAGHEWVGLDLAPAMLGIAREREVEGDLLLGDMGEGLPFRTGVFDGAVSISVLQWLCNADKAGDKPQSRLLHFFTQLYACLRRGARAIFQFYPANDSQIELITSSALRAGFAGGLVVDYPHSSSAKKYFLTLFAGPPTAFVAPSARMAPQDAVKGGAGGGSGAPRVFEGSRRRPAKKGAGKVRKGNMVKSKAWIAKKKTAQRAAGKDVREDSRYTGRRRRYGF